MLPALYSVLINKKARIYDSGDAAGAIGALGLPEGIPLLRKAFQKRLSDLEEKKERYSREYTLGAIISATCRILVAHPQDAPTLLR